MSVLIICFSCVSALADTSVDSGSISLAYFQKLIKDNNFSLDCSLAELPVDDYLVVAEYNTYYVDDYLYFNFIPRSGKKYAYVEDTINSANDLKKVVTVDNDTIYLCKNSQGRLYLYFSFDYYTLRLSNTSTLKHYSVSDAMYGMFGFYMYYGSDIKYTDNYFVNEKSLFDKISEVTTVYPLLNITGKSTLDYCSSLFAYCTQLVPGYTGHIVDTSFNGLLADKGLTCDDTITKNYKFQISYIKNNDLVMMFLNNNKKPDLKIEDYKDGLNSDAKKYIFTYNSSYDCIVYFPQYQKYLNYDDWYNSDSVPKDFRWFWTEDKKSFSLISDWNVSFDETGKQSYNGTRVVVNWKLDNTSIDNISLSKSWQVDKELLKDKGWQDGRPSDQNYPYCVQLWQNNIPVYSVYFNSKPKLRINRESDFYCEYAIDMIGMCGYVYSEWGDMSTQFDFTTGKVSKGNDILSQGQNVVWYLFNDLGGRADEKCLLHLYDNYKGDDEHFIGTKVFFNWDVTSNLFDTNLNNQPDFDYTKTLLKGEGSQYKDDNGHIHGGSLKNYDDEDLNKWNSNGKDENDNNSSSGSDFDFSFEGISEYCKDFWSFMQSSLALFPSFIWLLVGASVSVLIALRLLGR